MSGEFSFRCPEVAENVINRSIAITGVARSGTTLLGKLIHTLDNVEYFFEPPLLLPILLSIPESSISERSFLLESYLYEELFLGAIAGRLINTNKNDESSIFHAKSPSELAFRFSRSWRRFELEEISKTKTLAFKLPSAAAPLKEMKDRYPGMRVIHCFRRPQQVIASLLKKGWFKPKEAFDSPLRPYKWIGNRSFPWWVYAEDADRYYEYDETNRCAYYYLQVVACAQDKDSFEWVDYDRLVMKPLEVLEGLVEGTSLALSGKTLEVVGGISRRTPIADRSLLQMCSEDLKAIYEYA